MGFIEKNEFLLVFPHSADQDHGRYARLRTVHMDARAKTERHTITIRAFPYSQSSMSVRALL